MVYVFVTVDVKVTTPITEEDYTDQILWWIGFTTKGQSGNIYDDSNYSFSDIRILTEKYIFHISTEFGIGT